VDVEHIILRLRNDSAPGQEKNLGLLPSVTHLMREAADALERLNADVCPHCGINRNRAVKADEF
jgi:hypothetical protein